MKKYILALLVIGTVTVMAESVVEVRVGGDIMPQFDTSPEKDAKFSYELAGEYRYVFGKNVELGGGLAYQKHGKLKSFTDVEDANVKVEISDTELYDSIPLYLTARYVFRNDTDFIPYIKANLGYSFNINSDNSNTYKTIDKNTGNVLDEGKLRDFNAKNGMYYALGFGIEYKNIIADFSYQVNTADIDSTRYDGATSSGNADFSRMTLGVGYQFEF